MLTFILELLGMLLVILIAAEVFTNALEHLGERLGISEGVTGSLFAAIGTALPETLIPLLALFAGTSNANLNQEVGVGAILGAPLMLSTLSTCMMACFVLRARGLWLIAQGVIALFLAITLAMWVARVTENLVLAAEHVEMSTRLVVAKPVSSADTV